MTTRGVLLFANNNSELDYLKQACYCAKQIKKHLDLSITLITDSKDDFYKNYKEFSSLFDNILSFKPKEQYSNRLYKDSLNSVKLSEFKNNSRVHAYDLTPYDETIIMDTDVILFNSTFNQCFNQNNSILMYKRCVNVSNLNSYKEFNFITDTGIDFYWATCVYFKKDKISEIFFNLLKHVQENWDHYKLLYNVKSTLYRNDFVFSIAIHILNGHVSGNFVKPFPGTLYFSTDSDDIVELDQDSIKILSLSQDNKSMLVKLTDVNVHFMNKYSLQRNIQL